MLRDLGMDNVSGVGCTRGTVDKATKLSAGPCSTGRSANPPGGAYGAYDIVAGIAEGPLVGALFAHAQLLQPGRVSYEPGGGPAPDRGTPQ